jgi:crotonobetainyl-CoA:carnitine CoA-transferase CaiB-like acyl-CoA transferase
MGRGEPDPRAGTIVGRAGSRGNGFRAWNGAGVKSHGPEHDRRLFAMTEPHGPLHGVKVVACSTAQAGTVPYMLMADLGAEVIKIEVPQGGDPSRGSTVLPGLPSTYFETNNRGVKSLTLDLKTAEGREILRRLVARADIFGQNFRPGAAEKNGFGYEELKQVNPRLVYMSISGYGPKGPHADLPGTDSMAQALGGIAEAYSTQGQPMKTGIVSVADETCAILAFGGALAALTYAQRTGIGQKVECSLLGGQIRLMGWTLTTAMWRNRDPVTGQARVTGTQERPGLSASFNDRDGKPLVFQLNGARKWREAMTALGFYERLEEAGFGDLGVIVSSDEKRATLLRLLDELFATGSREEWVKRLRGADIVAAPINTLLEASNDPDVLANGYVTEVDYPDYGKRLKVHGSPWHFSQTPAHIGVAPALGADTDAVLASLGYSPAQIGDLRQRKII